MGICMGHTGNPSPTYTPSIGGWGFFEIWGRQLRTKKFSQILGLKIRLSKIFSRKIFKGVWAFSAKMTVQKIFSQKILHISTAFSNISRSLFKSRQTTVIYV